MNQILNYAINKYKLQDFIFIIFEYCKAEDLIKREQQLFFIDELRPEYNINPIAGSRLGSKHTPESLAKFSGENHPMFGKSHTDFTLEKMSNAKLSENNPMYGKCHSADTKLLMSIAKGGGTIYVYDTQGSLVNTFTSAREAAKEFGTQHQTILRYARNGNIFKDKWRFSTSLITNK